jgi:DNA-directed RNA polymerase specialized sigma24 family protein
MAEGSITRWIGSLKAGDAAAARPLWEAFFHRLVGLAREHLRGIPRRARDEEDVALSAFDSFCAGAVRGRFPDLSDRHNLWSLLVAVTRHKCVDAVRHEGRAKRGGKAVASTVDPDELFAREPSPEFAAELADEFTRRLGRLDATGDPTLRLVALAKLEGDTTDEIAVRLGCVRRTVERKLVLIERLWLEE